MANNKTTEEQVNKLESVIDAAVEVLIVSNELNHSADEVAREVDVDSEEARLTGNNNTVAIENEICVRIRAFLSQVTTVNRNDRFKPYLLLVLICLALLAAAYVITYMLGVNPFHKTDKSELEEDISKL